MTAPRSTEELISLWLEEEAAGPLPDRVLEASFERTRGTHQVRASAWRPFKMTRPIPALIAVGAAAVVIVAGAVYLRPGSNSNVGNTPPSPSPTISFAPTSSPSPDQGAIDTSSWVTFTSSQYGFAVGHPADWTVAPAERAWDLETDATDALSPGMEDFIDPTGDVRVSVWAIPIEPGAIFEPGTIREGWAAVEAWIEDVYCPKAGCTLIRDRVVPLCLEDRDCHPGMLVPGPDEVRVFFVGGNDFGDRIAAVTVWRSESDPAVARYGGSQRLLEAFLSTMDVWPASEIPGHAGDVMTFLRERQ
jgi:hypothetical protein